jgi:hypothetical protein
MGWVKDGQTAGTKGYGRPITSVQLRLIEKGAIAEDINKCSEAAFVDAKKMVIRVNTKRNVVTIYQGKKPIKVFLCAVNAYTKNSDTRLQDRHRWRSLYYGVNGQYAIRIRGNILFHSTPYRRLGNNRSLIASEYNKLGTNASAGCVRMAVEGVKYIYDNCPRGTRTILYKSNDPGPLGKPKLKKIPNKQNWDPTDTSVKLKKKK